MLNTLTMAESVNYHPDALRRFNKDIVDHEMAVLRDDGLYRHIRFQEPGTSMYYFDLLTSPGLLTINGDMGTYVFSRVEDMFEFFSHDTYVNASYWGEKLRSISSNTGYREHSEDEFRQFVLENFWERREQYEPADAKHIWQRIRDEFFDDWTDRSSGAACHALLRDFECNGFEYHDAWEHEFKDYSYQYLWCCHAILWGIQQYNATKKEA